MIREFLVRFIIIFREVFIYELAFYGDDYRMVGWRLLFQQQVLNFSLGG